MSDSTVDFETIYRELHRLAQRKVQAGLGGHSLQATALVHDVWVKLSEAPAGGTELDRSHFLATAAQAMRWLLVDRARRRRSQGIASVFGQTAAEVVVDPGLQERDERILALDEALLRLDEAFPRKADVVNHRFFAGLSVEETAQAMGVSPATVKREWSFARAWLIRELDGDGPDLFSEES